MGEMADEVLDGTRCKFCGCYTDEGQDGPGFPILCDDCEADGSEE